MNYNANNQGDANQGEIGPVALPPDDYRAVLAMAQAMTTHDVHAFAALQPQEPGQAHAMLLAAVTVITALASDDRLNGADTELARLLAVTLRIEANDA